MRLVEGQVRYWQIIPTALGRMLGDKDRDKANRTTQAMVGMSKIDIAALEAGERRHTRFTSFQR